MSEITLLVGGRHYPITCETGQEDHVRKLAAMVDSRLATLGSTAVTNDAKNMLFAALILADELEEARGPSHNGHASKQPSSPGDDIAALLERIAERLESTATLLEQEATTS